MIDKRQLIESLTICINDECDKCVYRNKGEYCSLALLHDVRELLTTQDGYRPADIVRCKDCKYGYMLPNSSDYVYCTKPYSGTTSHKPDWFCADGDRR